MKEIIFDFRDYRTFAVLIGRMAEWLNAPVLKTGVPERVSGVRIPILPQIKKPCLTCSDAAFFVLC